MVLVLAVATVLASVPAGAADRPTASYVTGRGALSDDWRDEGLLDAREHPRSDLVGLWQSVLWADGYLARAFVTCRYDGRTQEATRVWQSNHGLIADGVTGAQTLGFAAGRLVSRPPWTVYVGEWYALPLRRTGAGVYEAYDEGRFVPLRTDAATLHVCRDAH
ncbi:peptidoglycan-binding protein [Streptomyces sp. NPDC001544]|uniref:peptidoglycan-binding domain-containing protein n=1 Tax=Streptomyces sp. NPDC001544 TaxID=3364584 RepID=UPI0036AC97D5